MGRATALIIQRVTTASHVEFRRMVMTVQIVRRVCAIPAPPPPSPPCFAYARFHLAPLHPFHPTILYRRRCVNNPNQPRAPGIRNGKKKKKERKEALDPSARRALLLACFASPDPFSRGDRSLPFLTRLSPMPRRISWPGIVGTARAMNNEICIIRLARGKIEASIDLRSHRSIFIPLFRGR